jgi:hypothetical protein
MKKKGRTDRAALVDGLTNDVPASQRNERQCGLPLACLGFLLWAQHKIMLSNAHDAAEGGAADGDLHVA